MGRKKQARPHRTAKKLEAQASEAHSTEEKGSTSENIKGFDRDEPFYVDIDRSSWGYDEHYDISEIVLSNLTVNEAFYGYALNEEFYNDPRFTLRFSLSNVDEPIIRRIKLGHWPVIAASDICLEFIENNAVMVSGNFDAGDEGITGLIHLASLKLLTIRPVLGVNLEEGILSLRLRVEIMRGMFDECESVLDNTRQLWKKSMMSVMAWGRPEVLTSEARYGYSVATDMDGDGPVEDDGVSSGSRKQARFDVSSFYEAIKPSKKEPMLADDFPGLIPELRPYQRRAASWMVQREKGACADLGETERNLVFSPLCVPVKLIDTSRKFFYNPFSGNVSLDQSQSLPYVCGGILADEMGLGKTVELLACIFAHRMSTSDDNGSSSTTQVGGVKNNNWKRLKRERVECVCGAVTESYKYKGLWVQCDICDAWQHADCVGYSSKKRSKNSSGHAEENGSEENTRKHARRKNNSKIVEMSGDHICQMCSELIQATEPPVAAGATLIVCPTPILPQWHAEIIRHTKPGALRICVYEGVSYTSISDEPVIDMDELLNADIVLTTYDVLKEDLPHDSDRHEGDRRSLRYEKRYPVIPTPLTRILWWRICLDEAQMVESNAAAATELALRLHAKHRWCVTGTPIQQKLDDLYGLLKFLQASPFDVPRWWNDIIREPYEKGDAGAMLFTHNFFKRLMWRSSKVHVQDELQLPPQEESISWLSLSPIEEHFYQRQHETCVDDAREVIESFKDHGKKKAPGPASDGLSDRFITSVEAERLFNSLLKLRQACCHPQVGSSGLRSLQKSPMTMEEILSVLVGKTKVEGEDALRKLVVALNGLAGIAVLEKDFNQAVSLYKEALALVEEHSEDFRLDPLLNVHLHHNLAELLPLTRSCIQQFHHVHGSSKEILFGTCDLDEKDKCSMTREKVPGDDPSQNLSEKLPEFPSCSQGASCNAEPYSTYVQDLKNVCEDQNLSEKLPEFPSCSQGASCNAEPYSTYVQDLKNVCEDLKQRFLSVFIARLALAQQEFRKSYGQVCDTFRDWKTHHTTWWLEALDHIEDNKDSSSELLRKIEEALSGTINSHKKPRTSTWYRSIATLKYYVQTRLDSLQESRKVLLDRLLEIDGTMDNPREEDIARVRYCATCFQDCDGPACTHCELDEIFRHYEAHLFLLNKSNNGVITSGEEAINLQKKSSALNRFYWTLSRPDKGSTLSAAESEENGKKRDVIEKVTVSKSPSDLEVVLGLIRSNSKGFLDKEKKTAAKVLLHLLEGMRKEYALARSLAIAQAQILRAHDEIRMATSRLRLRENEDDKSIDALSPGELVAANAENSSEKFLALASLSRTKGQLRYLKGLVKTKHNLESEGSSTSTLTEASLLPENGCDGEPCPVCQEHLGNQKMVFQCGHVTCCKCFFAMTDRRHEKSCSNWVMCPTCRQPTDFGNVAYADDSQNESCGSYVQACDKTEASITVQGSYSTKIAAVTRRILWITSTDQSAKVLVFSSWKDVLDVLQHSFAVNGISYIRMKGGRKSQDAISQFKGQTINTKATSKKHNEQKENTSVQVLLLLVQHGANGLNLLEAQHVILVEPLLNPATEAQAVGRVHRIGQSNKTMVHRFIVKDTVEESIYKLNKSRNTSSFISGNRKNQDQPVLTVKDVESLFRVAPSATAEDQKPSSLRDLPPSVAAALAAEKRSIDNNTNE